ncbi:MAG: stearoyl-CoA 9-desaturase oxidoreductase [Mycobacterium sp.]|jgi:hypothetical protein|nr:stearoyl-CoA 9-desaturase oxidoreductase [Mycobacterium sp.]
MAATLRDLARWSVKPAKNVDTAKTPKVNVLRGLAANRAIDISDDYTLIVSPARALGRHGDQSHSDPTAESHSVARHFGAAIFG